MTNAERAAYERGRADERRAIADQTERIAAEWRRAGERAHELTALAMAFTVADTLGHLAAGLRSTLAPVTPAEDDIEQRRRGA